MGTWYIAHSGVAGMHWYHRFHQSYKVKPTRSGKIGQEHFHVNGGTTKSAPKSNTKTKNEKFHVSYNRYDEERDLKTRDDNPIKPALRAAGDFALGTLAGAVGAYFTAGDYYTKAISNTKKIFTVSDAKKRTKIDDERREKNKNFDKKLGLRLKNQEFTDDEDIKLINTRYGQGGLGATNNCASCSIAYEMRKRGYDVRAKQQTTGLNDMEIANVFSDAKINPIIDRKKSDDIKSTLGLNLSSVKNMNKELQKFKGSRGILTVTWGIYAMGHAINVEIDKDGNVTYIDCQSGKKWPNGKGLALNMMRNASSCVYIRTDNAKINKSHIKEVVE